MNEIRSRGEYSLKRLSEKIVILGSTGSVGRLALEVLREQPGRFTVSGLAAGRSSGEFAAQVEEFRPEAVSVRSRSAAERLSKLIKSKERAGSPKVMNGPDGLERLVSLPEVHKVVNALCGAAGIRPSLAAVGAGKTLLLANKEALVAAGKIITESAKKNKARILPLDSEHSAIFQCMRGENNNCIRKLIITASGGPFFNGRKAKKITPAMALMHPKWNMGPKVTVDSATLMNKGLEIMEAMWLFNVPVERIKVLVHPECIVHSMVEFGDGVTKAQLAAPDMKVPIRYALNFPRRVVSGNGSAVNLAEIGRLNFHEPDFRRFPCLELALAAAREQGLVPAMISAADEVAVDAFLKGRVDFDDIPVIIEHVLEWGRKHNMAKEAVRLQSILDADARARDLATRAVRKASLP
ncbi:MAG: 1-deoxy-D-xylulose-5-phosphate reductoisomerase [bacterium]